MITQTKCSVLDKERLPFRLTSEEVCEFLNCKVHDLPPLMTEKIITPLGKPAQQGKKFFFTEDILALAGDRKRMERVSECIRKHWQKQNGTELGEEGERLAA